MRRLRYAKKLFGHFVGFAVENKVYWIVPLVLVLVLLGVAIFTSQASTPFIYTLF